MKEELLVVNMLPLQCSVIIAGSMEETFSGSARLSWTMEFRLEKLWYLVKAMIILMIRIFWRDLVVYDSVSTAMPTIIRLEGMMNGISVGIRFRGLMDLLDFFSLFLSFFSSFQ